MEEIEDEVKIICGDCGRTDELAEPCEECPDYAPEDEDEDDSLESDFEPKACLECGVSTSPCRCEPEYYEDR